MTDTQTTPRPIADWENQKVDGLAAAGKNIFEDHKQMVDGLRKRQEKYENSLPSDPGEAFNEITKALNNMDGMTELPFAARAALTIIQELSMKGGLDDSTQMNEAVFWLTNQGLQGLALMEAGVRHARDISRKFHPMHKAYEA